MSQSFKAKIKKVLSKKEVKIGGPLIDSALIYISTISFLRQH